MPAGNSLAHQTHGALTRIAVTERAIMKSRRIILERTCEILKGETNLGETFFVSPSTPLISLLIAPQIWDFSATISWAILNFVANSLLLVAQIRNALIRISRFTCNVWNRTARFSSYVASSSVIEHFAER